MRGWIIALGLSQSIGIAAPAAAQNPTAEADIYLVSCAFSQVPENWKGECEQTQKLFREEYLPGGLKGDYTAQYNLAACFRGSCGGVKENRILSCAWQVVIMASGNTRVGPRDFQNYDLTCKGKLSPMELSGAHAQAEVLFQRIYQKDLPASFRP